MGSQPPSQGGFGKKTPCASLMNEAEFERKHAAGPAWRISQQHPEIRVFVHPERGKRKCQGVCDTGAEILSSEFEVVPGVGRRVRNGPWSTSLELDTISIWSRGIAMGRRWQSR